MSKPITPLAERFARHVDRAGPTMPGMKTPCHIWKGARSPQGYGKFRVAGRNEIAHRVAFLIVEGRWPRPCGLHTCDNPPCVNREHLFEGSRTDNARDRDAKGRVAHGDRHYATKYSSALVEAVRSAVGTHAAVGRALGVPADYVGEIRSGKRRRRE
jgi:hypothetical protein